MMNSHTVELRVRYEETDQMGVVYYANYLVWFEIVRTEFFRKKGIEYRKMEDEDKLYIPVVEAYCCYKLPLRYDDLISVTGVLTEVTKARMTFEYEIKCGERTAATGKTKHALINSDGKPVSIPEHIRAAIT
ncbi:MAG: thioesterase family protein [Candidatus Tantalella remota]|nr:thioesterase family protein [Candidatus Tantalella remota]